MDPSSQGSHQCHSVKAQPSVIGSPRPPNPLPTIVKPAAPSWSVHSWDFSRWSGSSAGSEMARTIRSSGPRLSMKSSQSWKNDGGWAICSGPLAFRMTISVTISRSRMAVTKARSSSPFSAAVRITSSPSIEPGTPAQSSSDV